MRQVLLAGPTPDAVFAASNLMAMGALRVLRGAGLSVPGDVAVVGFDDSPVCRNAEPGLSPPAETVLPTRLIERGLVVGRVPRGGRPGGR